MILTVRPRTTKPSNQTIKPHLPRPSQAVVDQTTDAECVDAGDLCLIDDMLALTPEERLDTLETTLRSLEDLLAATGSTSPAQ